MSDIVGAVVVVLDATEPRNADAGEGHDAGDAVSDAVDALDPTVSRDADVGDEGQREREPFAEVTSGADFRLGQLPAESGGAGSGEDDPGQVGKAVVELDVADRVEPPDDPDGLRARAAPATAPPRDLLSILGPRGPPSSGS